MGYIILIVQVMSSIYHILSFVTGLRCLPPLGLKENGGIVITFLRNIPTKSCPIADACFK